MADYKEYLSATGRMETSSTHQIRFICSLYTATLIVGFVCDLIGLSVLCVHIVLSVVKCNYL